MRYHDFVSDGFLALIVANTAYRSYVEARNREKQIDLENAKRQKEELANLKGRLK
jgi:hypothetical protein